MFHRPALVVALLSSFAAAPPVARAQQTRLDYRTEQSLKDAVYYVNQVEGLIAAMEKASADWKPGDPSVSIAKVDQVLATRDKCVTYLANANNRFKDMPAAHPKVAPELKRCEAAQARLDAVAAKAAEVRKGLDAIVKQGDAPEYKAAFDRLREISGQYAHPDVFRQLTVEQAETARQVAAAKDERQRIAAKYADLLKQPTPQAKEMNGVLAFSDERLAAYEKAMAAYLAAAPAAIEAEADDVLVMAREGVAQKKPGYFGEHGGVTSHVRRAEEHARVLATLAPDAESTRKAAEKVRATRATVEQMAAAFADSVVASNALPRDEFNGPDRDALLKTLADKWAKEGNGQPILKTGVIDAQWNRQVKWEWRPAISAWEKSDKSRVQGYVVTKLSDKEAAVWPVDFVKNHLSNGAVGAYFLYDVKADPGVGSRLLLTHVK